MKKKQFVKVSGQFCSYHRHDGERSHLEPSIFVREFETDERESGEQSIEHDENKIFRNVTSANSLHTERRRLEGKSHS